MKEITKIEESLMELHITKDNEEDIQFLNDGTGSSPQILEDDLPSAYLGIEGLEEIVNDERKKIIIERFEPESLSNLQAIGLDLKDCINDTLQQLAMNAPAKIILKTSELLSDMVLLIRPYASSNEKLALKVVPYIKH